jgi:peptidoglycan/xylan/chitin deacetylase (PgdA/CDA1 family)
MQGSAPPIRGVAASRAARAVLIGTLSAIALFTSAGPANAAATVVYHGSRSERVVALTFDDAWSPPVVRRILSILAREHVAATFFPVSFAVRTSPGVWRRALREGHAIGDHTINHPVLTALPGRELRRQLIDSQRMMRAAIGKPISPYMRPPYGMWNNTVVRAASAAGFKAVVMWDVDARDWEGWTPGRLVRNATRGTNGSIVVMHALPATVRVLPRIIRYYRHRGFRFVTVPQLLGTAPAVNAARAASAKAPACPDSIAARIPAPLAFLTAPVSQLLGAASVTAQLYRSWIARALLASGSLSSLGTAYLALARVPVALPLGPPGCNGSPPSTASPGARAHAADVVRRLK